MWKSLKTGNKLVRKYSQINFVRLAQWAIQHNDCSLGKGCDLCNISVPATHDQKYYTFIDCFNVWFTLEILYTYSFNTYNAVQ